ncbi:unnamed protein product [Clonostachys rosea f. rosea IK726]|uniref:Uncharacterized protein n=1 Tax=Clonostachys rosea f. rosea IK726 TaxID=1349383 RepID=A0ACA9T7I1_BIOOC|nr:unnamed protein product [Clonostachys rosea f. rosea IK726]
MNQIPQPELANTMPQAITPAAGKPRDPSWPEPRRRPRVPQVYGIVHCIKRSLGVMLDLGGIVMCIMYAAKYPPRAGSGIVPTIGAFIALAIDLAEVIGTANGSRRIPRAHPGLTFFIDFVVMIFFLVGFLMLFLSDFGESSKPRPWLDAVSEMLIIECLSFSIRIIFLIWACIDCCVRKSQRKQRVIYVPVVFPTDTAGPGIPPPVYGLPTNNIAAGTELPKYETTSDRIKGTTG